MKKFFYLRVLFLVGIMLFVCRNLYAYTAITWPRNMGPDLIILRNVLVVICIILVLIVIKAKKEGDKDLKEGKKSDESVQNFLKHHDEKSGGE